MPVFDFFGLSTRAAYPQAEGPPIELVFTHVRTHLVPSAVRFPHRLAAHSILAARAAVFVVEQTCPYQDMDGVDAHSLHLTAWQGEKVAAHSRIVPPAMKFAEPSMAVCSHHRSFMNGAGLLSS